MIDLPKIVRIAVMRKDNEGAGTVANDENFPQTHPDPRCAWDWLDMGTNSWARLLTTSEA